MHALFVSLSTETRVPNPHVFLFDDDGPFLKFAIDTLVDAQFLTREPDGTFTALYTDGHGTLQSENLLTAKDALEYVQESLGGSEYFHIYEVTDKRLATTVSALAATH